MHPLTTILTPPAAEPITLAQAKAHLRLDALYAGDDDLINTLILAARQACEARTGRRLITQTLRLEKGSFPAGALYLYTAPVQSITAITWLDAINLRQTLSPAVYELIPAEQGACVMPAHNESWPDALYSRPNAVRVDFVAGYGPAGNDVPAPLRQWMLTLIGTLYTQREGITNGLNLRELPRTYVDGLLDPYILYGAA